MALLMSRAHSPRGAPRPPPGTPRSPSHTRDSPHFSTDTPLFDTYHARFAAREDLLPFDRCVNAPARRARIPPRGAPCFPRQNALLFHPRSAPPRRSDLLPPVRVPSALASRDGGKAASHPRYWSKRFDGALDPAGSTNGTGTPGSASGSPSVKTMRREKISNPSANGVHRTTCRAATHQLSAQPPA